MKKIIAILVLSLFLLFQAVAQDDEEKTTTAVIT
jgi:putative cell wall-binding protein